MKNQIKHIAGFILCASLVLMSCTNAINQDAKVSLKATKWNLVAINDSLVGKGFGVTFDENTMNGITTCNNIHGACVYGVDYITCGQTMMTQMACADADFKMENRLASLLNDKIHFEVTDATLVLRKDEDVFRFEKME